ncbi:ProQ/FINO family protein [Rickettsia gravesii]|uniref:ProQ/FINO family protein n=1 Tax=Rickettsia gravesii TaxID=354585 RepID=UPI0003813A97|nr:ProQ/FINO family protein [Rickettsia gravesii]
MNTLTNTDKPKLKLNFGAKPLTLNTNATSLVPGLASKKVVVFEKPREDDIAPAKVGKAGSNACKSDASSMSDNPLQKEAATDAPKAKSKDEKKNKKQEAAASNKVVASPEEIMKAKIKRHKKEYFSILTKLQTDYPTDYPECFSKDIKLLAIGIHLELKNILNGKFPNNQLSRFFHRYCGSFKYKEKLVEGAQRFNLDGSPATLVTKKEIPPIIKKPKFVKKPNNVANAAKTVSNEIQPT